jgi:hypothetical protein
MNITDLAYMAAAMVALATLRFGLPALITWAVAKATHHFTPAAY